MPEKKGQNFLHGAAIYTVGIIIIKILGAIYKIPLMSILHDDGYGHFMVTYNIYNFFLVISTAGMPTALSRMIAEESSLGHKQQVRKIFRVTFLAFVALGAAGTLTMLLFRDWLAVHFGQDGLAAQGIFVMSPSVLLVCMTAAYLGYAQGHGDMIPTTICEVLETGSKVLVGLTLAILLAGAGKSMDICAAGALVGTSVSSLVAFTFARQKIHRRYVVNPPVTPESDVPRPGRKVLGDLLRIGIPLTISTAIMTLITLIDQYQVRRILVNALGYSEEVRDVLYGVYSKAVTLYNLPYAFVVPLMASIVPAISAARMEKRLGDACYLAETSLRMATLICLPMCVGMGVLCWPCMNVLLDSQAQQGPLLLLLMSVASYLMVTTLMTNSILPANGNERLSLISIMIGGVLKVLANWILVSNPKINIYGAPIGTILCYLVITGMNLFFIARRMQRPMNIARIFLRNGISATAMGLAAWGVWTLLHGLMGSALIPFAAAVLAGVVVYGVMVIVLRAITLEDVKLIPKGEKVAKLLHIR